MRKAGTIEEYKFVVSDLTANAAGLFDLYSNRSVNGTIQNISFLNNTFTATGSLMVFASGTENEFFMKIRAGSTNQVYYPFVYTYDNNQTTGSPNIATQRVVNSPIRIVGSGLGNGTSGLGIIIRYI